MIHKKKIMLLLLTSLITLSGCDYSKSESKDVFFYNTFAVPMDNLLHWLGSIFDNNYGLSIITIVLIVRLIMLPFMLAQSKNGHFMRKKMDIVKPEMTKIQEKLKMPTFKKTKWLQIKK